ncbi:MAG: hypothetical protein OXQ84_00455 [bacterium]|nr:hypothetical protein [bacterium]
MSRGTTVFAVIVSVLLIGAAGVLNMLARQGGDAVFADAVAMATEIRDSVQETGASAVDGALETTSRLVAVLESVPDLTADLAEDVVALREGLQQRRLVIDAIRDADAALSESIDAWRSAVESAAGEAPDLVGLTEDMDRYLTGAGPAPPLDAVRSHGDVTLVAAANRLVSERRALDELHQGLASDRVTGVAEQLVMSLEIERARRALVVRNYDDGTVAALGALVLFWVLLGIRGRRRSEPAQQKADPVTGTLFIRGTAAAVAMRAQRLASHTNALRESRQRLESAIAEAGLDRSLNDDAPLHREVEAMDGHLATLRDETGELSALGQRLWTLAGETAPASTASINACVREALEAIRAGHRIPVMTELADVGHVRGVASDIVLALTALIERVLTASRVSGLDHSAIRVFTTAGDDQVHVTITGGAPLPRLTERTFRPSGTSHELALAIALLRRHGGSVTLGSSIAGEASARISLAAASGDQT